MDCFRLRSSSYGGQVVAALVAMMNELPPPVTPAVAAAADIGEAHQLRHHAHQLAAADTGDVEAAGAAAADARSVSPPHHAAKATETAAAVFLHAAHHRTHGLHQ